jgi:hypothetical protein
MFPQKAWSDRPVTSSSTITIFQPEMNENTHLVKPSPICTHP